MLIKNPITEILYEGDYNGLENIYEFWCDNRNELLKTINRKQKYIPEFDNALKAFELKIRWSSYYGLWFRFYTQMYCSEQQTSIDFRDIMIQYGGNAMYLGEILYRISGFVNKTDLVDLRGVSLLKMHVKSTVIEGVDFSYASFDHSSFRDVIFNNCRFDRASFMDCFLESCYFDTRCTMIGVDFSNAYVNSQFDCNVKSPIITRAKWYSRVFNTYITNRCTEIKDESFYS